MDQNSVKVSVPRRSDRDVRDGVDDRRGAVVVVPTAVAREEKDDKEGNEEDGGGRGGTQDNEKVSEKTQCVLQAFLAVCGCISLLLSSLPSGYTTKPCQ